MDTGIIPELDIPSLEGKVSAAEWRTRVNLAAAYRVAYHYGWNDTVNNHIAARIPDAPDTFVMNPQGMFWNEMTASSLIKADIDGNVLSDSPLKLAPAGKNFHTAILRLRPDLGCSFHIHPKEGVIVSATMEGLRYFDQGACTLYGTVGTHDFRGLAQDAEEGPAIVGDLGDNMCLIMWNHGLLTVGRTIGEAFVYMHALVSACETQVGLMATGAAIREVAPEIVEHTSAQMAARRGNQPHGENWWPAYVRLAERLDPSFRT